MSQSCVRGAAAAGRALWLAATLCLIPFAIPAHAGETIPVDVDRARLIELPPAARTVVIGNPLIADLSIQPGGLAVITGKGYGTTNVIALDKDGAVLAEKTVLVHGPSGPTVIVYRGSVRNTYSCTPDCEPQLTLGDEKDYFDLNAAQNGTRTSAAMASGIK